MLQQSSKDYHFWKHDVFALTVIATNHSLWDWCGLFYYDFIYIYQTMDSSVGIFSLQVTFIVTVFETMIKHRHIHTLTSRWQWHCCAPLHASATWQSVTWRFVFNCRQSMLFCLEITVKIILFCMWSFKSNIERNVTVNKHRATRHDID